MLSSIGAFECKFVLATVPAPETEKAVVNSALGKNNNDSDSEEEYISGTEDEL